MASIRRQLTLFVADRSAGVIEKIRQKYNPAQYALIKSHVTLCREDELIQIESIVKTLEKIKFAPVVIQFDNPIRFNDGKGVLLPAKGENSSFQLLRKAVLKDVIEFPRIAEPHITYMHPRNSSCTDEIFKQICQYDSPHEIHFYKISLIEQYGTEKWQIIQSYDLY